MSGTLRAPAPPPPSALPRIGLVATHTLLARRVARMESCPSGSAGGPVMHRSDQFGFMVQLPFGWVSQTGEAVYLAPYGLVELHDLEVLTPSGARLRVGVAVEPSHLGDGALDRLTRMFADWSGAEVVDRETHLGEVRSCDLTMARGDGSLLIARLFVTSRRVVCVDATFDADTAADDDALRAALEGFLLLPCPRVDGRSSGTYPIDRAGRDRDSIDEEDEDEDPSREGAA